MNVTLNRMIHESGEIWSDGRDRTANPVLVKLDEIVPGKLFELTLPKGEDHPYWRVVERDMTTDEVTAFNAWYASLIRQPKHIGELMSEDHPIRGYIFNGRMGNQWARSAEGFGLKEVL